MKKAENKWEKFTGLLRNYQANQYTYYKILRIKQKEPTKILLQEMMAGNFYI